MKKMLPKAKLRQLCVLSSCQSRAYFAITHIKREFVFAQAWPRPWGWSLSWIKSEREDSCDFQRN